MKVVTVEDVAQSIRKKLGGKLSADAILDSESSFDEIGLSSLQIADIVYGLEDELGVRFDPQRAAAVRTIGDLVEFANASVGQVAAATEEHRVGQ